MSDNSINRSVLFFGSVAFILFTAIMVFLGLSGTFSSDMDDYEAGYKLFLDIWGFGCLAMGVLLLGATIYTVPHDEYFDKEQLYFVVPGAWFVFDAMRCFSGNATRENPIMWCVTTVGIYGILLAGWSILACSNTGKHDGKLTLLIAILFAAAFFVQRNNFYFFLLSESTTWIAPLIVPGLMVLATLILTLRFIAKMRE